MLHIWNAWAKDSQKIKIMIKIPRITDEVWNYQTQLSGPEEQKKKEKTPVSSSKALFSFSFLYVGRLFNLL